MTKIVTVIAASNTQKGNNPDERQAAFSALLSEVARQGVRPRISTDPEMYSHYRGLLKAWRIGYDEAVERKADWCLVLEEDARINPYLFDNLPAVIQTAQAAFGPQLGAIQLGAMSEKMAKYHKAGAHWVERNWLAWHWGVVISTENVARVLELSTELSTEPKFMDDLISLFVILDRKRVAIPVPNLVTHQLPNHAARRQNLKSLFGRERVSSCYFEGRRYDTSLRRARELKSEAYYRGVDVENNVR